MSDLDTLLNELDDAGSTKSTRAKRPSLPNRFMRVEDFNANSSDQVVELSQWINAHVTTKADKVKLPKRRDSNEDDEDALSTEKKYLKQAAKRHPVFRLILDCRERSKLLTTYNWSLTEDGRVTGTIGWHPSTLRKSMRDYNLQNVPKRSDLANEFRRMIVAPPGYVLMEADSSAIEAVLVGYFARSERLIKLAKSGVHDWFNAHVHGWHIDSNMSLDDLRPLCKEAKKKYSKESREVAKRVVHLTNYRGTPERMQDEYPDEFATVSVARKLQNLYLETEPGRDLQRWWINTLERANHDRYLVTPFGMRHRFFHIYGWDSKRKQHILGDDAKRAIAFLPQSSASAIQDIILAYLYYETEFREWLRLPIHDSGLSYVPIDKVDSAADIMLGAFTMPFPELGGLTIGAEVKASAPGGNWADYDEVVNPLGMRTLR